MSLNLLFIEIEVLAVHPLQSIHGGSISGTGVVNNAGSNEAFGNGFEVHGGHTQLLVYVNKLVHQ